MLALFAAVTLGVAFGGLVGAVFTGDWIYTVVASIAFAIGSLAGAFAAFGTYAGGFRRPSPDGLTLPGEMALARVESIRRTGLSVNDQPQVELTLTVAPRTRPAYTTVHREIVDIVALPQLQPGSIIVVRRPDPDKANVLLDFNPLPDWARARDAERRRTGSERTVPLMEQTTTWASEPQTLSGMPRTPGNPWKRLLWVGVFGASAALVLLPAYDTIGRVAVAWASGDPASAGVVQGNRHQQIVDALERETGGSQFIRIGFYDEYALAAAPSEPGALTIDSYSYRYDRTSQDGPELIQPQDPAAALFDANEYDFSQIPGFIAAAKESSGITDPDSVIVIVDRSGVADASGAIPVRAMVLLDSPYEDANVEFDLATGEPLA
jgi:hypothetical protein